MLVAQGSLLARWKRPSASFPTRITRTYFARLRGTGKPSGKATQVTSSSNDSTTNGRNRKVLPFSLFYNPVSVPLEPARGRQVESACPPKVENRRGISPIYQVHSDQLQTSVRPPGIARTSRSAAADLGLGTASRLHKLVQQRSGVRFQDTSKKLLVCPATSCPSPWNRTRNRRGISSVL